MLHSNSCHWSDKGNIYAMIPHKKYNYKHHFFTFYYFIMILFTQFIACSHLSGTEN